VYNVIAGYMMLFKYLIDEVDVYNDVYGGRVQKIVGNQFILSEIQRFFFLSIIFTE